MYDELVKRLRNRRICIQQSGSLDDFPLLAEAADAIEELSKPRWIPVTERLPEDDIVCILTNGISDAIGYRGKVFGWHLIWTDYVVESEVTHWMPLPEPPKEE